MNRGRILAILQTSLSRTRLDFFLLLRISKLTHRNHGKVSDSLLDRNDGLV